jgi:hypothetical protein
MRAGPVVAGAGTVDVLVIKRPRVIFAIRRELFEYGVCERAVGRMRTSNSLR